MEFGQEALVPKVISLHSKITFPLGQKENVFQKSNGKIQSAVQSVMADPKPVHCLPSYPTTQQGQRQPGDQAPGETTCWSVVSLHQGRVSKSIQWPMCVPWTSHFFSCHGECRHNQCFRGSGVSFWGQLQRTLAGAYFLWSKDKTAACLAGGT